jgi:hypothetical protein
VALNSPNVVDVDETVDRSTTVDVDSDKLGGPTMVDIDKAVIGFLLGPKDRKFSTVCNMRPSQFGLPNSKERRKVDDRKRYLRDMMKNNPSKFAGLCKKHDLTLKMHGDDAGLFGHSTREPGRLVATSSGGGISHNITEV